MVIGDDRRHFFIDESRGLRPGRRLPIVLCAFFHGESTAGASGSSNWPAHGCSGSYILRNSAKFAVGSFFAVMQFHPVLRAGMSRMWRKSCAGRRVVRQRFGGAVPKDLREGPPRRGATIAKVSSACFSQAPLNATQWARRASVQNIAVSEAIHDWLSCCDRKYASTGYETDGCSINSAHHSSQSFRRTQSACWPFA